MQIEADVQHLWYEFTPFEVGCDEIGGGEPLLYHDKGLTAHSVDTLVGTWETILAR